MRTILDEQATYNTETGTTLQTRVIPLFEYWELNDDAKNRVISEYADERANDPYFDQFFSDSYERDIWECVHELEKSITGANVKWSYNRWYSCDFDCEYSINDIDWLSPDVMRTIENTGYYASMDLCDAWNKHMRKLNAFAMKHEYISELCDGPYYYEYWYEGQNPENKYFYKRLDDMRNKIFDAWIEELEAACKDVQDTIETLLRDEWENYTSEEYTRAECEDEYAQGCEYRTTDKSGRVYYSDSRKWYTADGELYDQSNINHACVSIVKAF